ncbi:unnamed protein product [Phytophthora fragariaefolia]|uniref:Unnamed protein product n=1 Tax=Phytophthora fragariaefolia TaxID=1490495 RepID=A0A9W6X6J5_9STRA|nr:unnamed protein product [Phytophthora fragariaefolia]
MCVQSTYSSNQRAVVLDRFGLTGSEFSGAMASPLRFQYATLRHFERAHATLSDSVIGHVLPRRQTGKRYFRSDSDEAPWNPLQSEQEFSSEVFATGEERPSYRPAFLCTPPYQTSTVSVAVETALSELSTASPWHMMSVDEMRKDFEKQQSLRELEKSFTNNVSMGSVTGTNQVLEQLRRYSLYFGEQQIQLKLVESVAPGVLTASARLGLTVSDYTLHCVPASGENQQ